MAPPLLSSSLLLLFILLTDADTSPLVSVGLENPDVEIKCGSCPCSKPCIQRPPPPPPPPYCNPALSPPPPPPRFIYTTGVPGHLSPPPPRFIYTTGVPDNVYQTDVNSQWYYFSGGTSPKPAVTAALVVAFWLWSFGSHGVW